MRVGITLPLECFQGREVLELARRAEDLGYTDAWSMESFATDAFSPLAAAAAVTERLRLGTAIVPVYTRPPALIAMSAATIAQISDGRFVLGLGISTPTIVDQWMGVPYRRPITRTRQTVAALRAILRREKVSIDADSFRISGFRLDIASGPPIPIYLAAQGPKMLRLAGEISDGLITNFVTPQTLPAMLEHFFAGAREAGKDPAALDVICRIIVLADEDRAAAVGEMRRHLTAYLTVPQYNDFFRGIGFEREASAAASAWQAGDRKAALQCVPDEMVHAIYVIGTAEECREKLASYGAAGVKTASLWFSALSKDPAERRTKILATLQRLAPR